MSHASPAVSQQSTVAPASAAQGRLEAVDLLRGLVMVLMALDHTRGFFGNAQLHNPLNLASTTIPLFLTRWITHYCAPTFILFAGAGAFLSGTRGMSKRDLSWYLITRGLWLVLLELTVIRWAGWSFAVNIHQFAAAVIWAIGWSMVVLALLVHLPVRAIAIVGLTMIATHNAFDSVKAESWGPWAWLWRVLHARGPIEFAPGFRLSITYPLIPWIGVMACGYALGTILVREPAIRRRWLLRAGLIVTLAFVLLRLGNFYGDPRPWSPQSRGAFTVLSFLDCHKYPPSLCYLLMTLGPALLLLALFDRETPSWLKPVLVFGRVPLFFYLLHLPLIHGLAIFVKGIRLAHPGWFDSGIPAIRPPTGFGLSFVYLAWITVVLILYPMCRWYAGFKRRRRSVWLSYL